MPVVLLERSEVLATMEAVRQAAWAGTGSVVVVGGEAGVGKTSVVRSFVAGLEAGVRILAGACDDLVTPRTLGPIREALSGYSERLDEILASGERSDVLHQVLAAVVDATVPTALVIEDIHWADEATLDVLHNLAALEQRQGHTDCAVALYDRVLATYRRTLDPRHPDLAATLHNVALAIAPVDPAGACALRSEAIDLLQGQVDPDHPTLLVCRQHHEALVLPVTGDPERHRAPTAR